MTVQASQLTTTMAATCEQLVGVLRDVGKEPVLLTSEARQSVLVLPYGARVLGLFGAESPANFLWTHPALLSTETAHEFYASDRWHNSGGDRTWLAPELEFFFPNLPDTSVYVQPRPLDAGEFIVRATTREVVLHADFSLRYYRARTELPVRLTKTVRIAANPLSTRHAGNLGGELEFAGYELHTSLRLLESPPPNAWMGIWNLLQLPGGGELLAPTYCKTHPTVFFGDIPRGDLIAKQRMIHYWMRAAGEQKICLPAIATTGRLGYRYAANNREVLVVRQFDVDLAARYVDVWHTRPNDDGYAVQACNIQSPSLGCFAEMEYHAPAIGGTSGEVEINDYSTVWAYRGARTAVRQAARLLLGDED